MKLIEAQQLFARLLPRLLDHAHSMGYDVTLGEAWRPPETARLYAQQGRGSVQSLHILRLAVDLNLFQGGVYLTSTVAHQPLGEWWEQQHPLCRWGGRFTRPDGNHYSISWEGRA